MGTLTVRPQPEHEDALAAVGALLQEKRASQTLFQACGLSHGLKN